MIHHPLSSSIIIIIFIIIIITHHHHHHPSSPIIIIFTHHYCYLFIQHLPSSSSIIIIIYYQSSSLSSIIIHHHHQTASSIINIIHQPPSSSITIVHHQVFIMKYTIAQFKLLLLPVPIIVCYFLQLFIATFLKETAFFSNYDPSFLKSNRYCLLSLQVTWHSAPSSLCILTVHTQHASPMSNPTSIKHSQPDARSIFIPCI